MLTRVVVNTREATVTLWGPGRSITLRGAEDLQHFHRGMTRALMGGPTMMEYLWPGYSTQDLASVIAKVEAMMGNGKGQAAVRGQDASEQAWHALESAPNPQVCPEHHRARTGRGGSLYCPTRVGQHWCQWKGLKAA